MTSFVKTNDANLDCKLRKYTWK